MSPKDLGAVFHLGHSHGSSCTIPSTTIPLTLFDITGVHTVDVTYCECDPNGPGIPPRVQLLRARWFPATWRRPNTAFSFRLLNFFHKLQSKCKINLYDFHATVASIFDNAGLEKPVVRTPPAHNSHTRAAYIICRTSTTNFPWSSVFTYTCVNSGGVAVHILLVGSLRFRRVAWPSNVQHAHTLAGILSYRRRGS